jgi:CRP-like cAMP-binding protein
MKTTRHAPLPEFGGNRLLAALSGGDAARLRPHFERVALTQGRTLQKAQAPLDYVYFPEAGVVSLTRPLKDGAAIEVALLGREGMVGTTLLTGADTTALEALAQMPGAAWRLPASVLLEAMERHPGFKASLLRFTQALLLQIYQTAACNGRHTLEQRLARWLLMVRDRVDRDELPLKHEFIALLLGTRRASVSVAMAGFKAAGLVAAGHGHVILLDRRGLERTACECYRTIRDQSRALLRD